MSSAPSTLSIQEMFANAMQAPSAAPVKTSAEQHKARFEELLQEEVQKTNRNKTNRKHKGARP